jgi:hypothetical protein
VTPREDIYAALFAVLPTAVEGVVTKSRLLKHWADVPLVEQPALFQAQEGEDVIASTGLPNKWLLHVSLYLYTSSSDGDSPPVIAMNDLLDKVQAAFQPDNLNKNTFTLGGLVEWCRIAGKIEQDGGTLGTQCVAIVPVEILMV